MIQAQAEEAQAARIAELEAALSPLIGGSAQDDEGAFDQQMTGIRISVGDVRRARAALAEEQKP